MTHTAYADRAHKAHYIKNPKEHVSYLKKLYRAHFTKRAQLRITHEDWKRALRMLIKAANEAGLHDLARWFAFDAGRYGMGL